MFVGLLGLVEFIEFIGFVKDRGQEQLITISHTETQGTQETREKDERPTSNAQHPTSNQKTG